MIFSHSPSLVFAAFGLVAVWLCLVAYFLRYVRTRHPAEFSALGEPSFQRGSRNVLAYLFRRRHRKLGDRHFSLLCDAMLICFVLVVSIMIYSFSLNGRLPSIRSGA